MKKKTGRPKAFKKPVRIGFVIDAAVVRDIKAGAKGFDMTPSDFMRAMIYMQLREWDLGPLSDANQEADTLIREAKCKS